MNNIKRYFQDALLDKHFCKKDIVKTKIVPSEVE